MTQRGDSPPPIGPLTQLVRTGRDKAITGPFVNPPVVNKELGIRRSYLSEARRVAGEFLKRQLQLIVFCQSRLSTEILTTYLKDDFEGPPGTAEQVRGYRGGYLPLRRREIIGTDSGDVEVQPDLRGIQQKSKLTSDGVRRLTEGSPRLVNGLHVVRQRASHFRKAPSGCRFACKRLQGCVKCRGKFFHYGPLVRL